MVLHDLLQALQEHERELGYLLQLAQGALTSAEEDTGGRTSLLIYFARAMYVHHAALALLVCAECHVFELCQCNTAQLMNKVTGRVLLLKLLFGQ